MKINLSNPTFKFVNSYLSPENFQRSYSLTNINGGGIFNCFIFSKMLDFLAA